MLKFEFLEPENLSEAVKMLMDNGEDACVFAGGSALLLAMRQRMIAPGAVVSLGRLRAMRGVIFSQSHGLRIGAMTPHAEIARSEAVRVHYPVLAQVFSGLANPQIRNQGTIGGNLCYADPATDPPSCLVSLGAEMVITGPMGERHLPIREFLVDFFTTALAPGEILTEIRVPAPRADFVGHYRRYLRTPAAHRPIANVALAMTSRRGIWEDVRLVVGASVPVTQDMTRAAALLNGRSVTMDLADEAASLVVTDLNVISDERGSAAFRTQVVRAATRRIIADAAGLDWKETVL